MSSHIQRRGGVAEVGAAWAAAACTATGGGIQSHAGPKKTMPSNPRPSHWRSHGKPCTRAATATPETAMPKPSPTKCSPSCGRCPCRISQLSTRPDASSSPAVLENPATNRSTDQTGTLSVQPIAAVLTTAITRPHR